MKICYVLNQYSNLLIASAVVCVCSVSRHIQLFEIPWTVAHQALLSMGFPRQEYLSGWAFPPPGDLPDPGIELVSLAFPAWAGGFFTVVLPGNLIGL